MHCSFALPAVRQVEAMLAGSMGSELQRVMGEERARGDAARQRRTALQAQLYVAKGSGFGGGLEWLCESGSGWGLCVCVCV